MKIQTSQSGYRANKGIKIQNCVHQIKLQKPYRKENQEIIYSHLYT